MDLNLKGEFFTDYKLELIFKPNQYPDNHKYFTACILYQGSKDKVKQNFSQAYQIFKGDDYLYSKYNTVCMIYNGEGTKEDKESALEQLRNFSFSNIDTGFNKGIIELNQQKYDKAEKTFSNFKESSLEKKVYGYLALIRIHHNDLKSAYEYLMKADKNLNWVQFLISQVGDYFLELDLDQVRSLNIYSEDLDISLETAALEGHELAGIIHEDKKLEDGKEEILRRMAERYKLFAYIYLDLIFPDLEGCLEIRKLEIDNMVGEKPDQIEMDKILSEINQEMYIYQDCADEDYSDKYYENCLERLIFLGHQKSLLDLAKIIYDKWNIDLCSDETFLRFLKKLKENNEVIYHYYYGKYIKYSSSLIQAEEHFKIFIQKSKDEEQYQELRKEIIERFSKEEEPKDKPVIVNLPDSQVNNDDSSSDYDFSNDYNEILLNLSEALEKINPNFEDPDVYYHIGKIFREEKRSKHFFEKWISKGACQGSEKCLIELGKIKMKEILDKN